MFCFLLFGLLVEIESAVEWVRPGWRSDLRREHSFEMFDPDLGFRPPDSILLRLHYAKIPDIGQSDRLNSAHFT